MTITSNPLLMTRLAAPRPGHQLIARPELMARLDAGLNRRLILITAPAGFGKTTLLADWLLSVERRASSTQAETGAQLPHPVGAQTLKTAWLALDTGDNDPARFLTYLIAALQQAVATIGAATLALLQAPQLADEEALLVPLANDLAGLGQQVVLVLDDYHLIEAEPVQRAVGFLLDHALPRLTLVLAGRSVPPLALARLRARGELVELGADELRVSHEQAAAFLHDVMELELTTGDVAALEARTEGWIAGLQLAALSMRGRADVAGFLAAFAGSNRYILDYLSDEVLGRQPVAVQQFLLQTSILDRLCGPLCDALLGNPDGTAGQAMLEQLERANLFISPLDSERRWYRYHQLFADMLRARLRQTLPAHVPMLQQRAAAWFADHGLRGEAIGYYLAAGDNQAAAGLVEQLAPTLLVRSQVTTLLGWLKALPEPVVLARPALCLAYAWALVATGQLDSVEPWLGAVERNPTSTGDDDLVGETLAVRATLAGLRRDQPDTTVALGQAALARLSDAKSYVRGVVALMLGAAHYQRSDLVAAVQSFAEAEAIGRATGNLLSALFALRQLAELEVLRGRLHQAAAIYRRALRLAEVPGSGPLPAAGTAYVGLGELQLEWNDLSAACESLTRGIELGEQAANVEILLRGYSALAWARQAEGDQERARLLIARALDTATATGVAKLIGWMRQVQARLLLRQGDLATAMRWVRERGITPDDTLQFFGEDDYIALARVLLAEAGPDRANPALVLAGRLLSQLHELVVAMGSVGTQIEILVLQALVHQARGRSDAAQSVLERALGLAAPEGYVRLFVDEGEPMLRLLRQLQPRSAQAAYIRLLLAAGSASKSPEQHSDQTPPKPASPSTGALIEPLSEREREVLELTAQGLSNQEIAERLVVALSTVKKHLNSTYSKLGVRSRTQALLRARELGLLP